MEIKNLTNWLVGRLIALSFCSAFAFSSEACDYRGMMKTYLGMDNPDAFTAKDLNPSFSEMAMDKGYSLNESKIILRDFSGSYLKDLTLNWLEGVFREFVCDEDWQVYSETFSTPEGVAAKQQMDGVKSKLEKDLPKKLVPVLLNIMAGQKVEKPKLDVPKDYKKAFHAYWMIELEETYGLRAFLMSLVEYGDSKAQKSFFSYLMDNLEDLLMECYYPDLSKESLLLYTRFHTTKSGKHIMAASHAVLLRGAALDEIIAQKFGEFLDERFVSDPPKDLFLKPLEDAAEDDVKG